MRWGFYQRQYACVVRTVLLRTKYYTPRGNRVRTSTLSRPLDAVGGLNERVVSETKKFSCDSRSNLVTEACRRLFRTVRNNSSWLSKGWRGSFLESSCIPQTTEYREGMCTYFIPINVYAFEVLCRDSGVRHYTILSTCCSLSKFRAQPGVKLIERCKIRWDRGDRGLTTTGRFSLRTGSN